MKKKNVSFISLFMIVFLVAGVTFSSCSKDDEPTPEIVTESDAFFITGQVQAAGKALAGAKVNVNSEETETDANGMFKLTVAERGDYQVVFSKDNYVTISSEASFAANVESRSSIAIRQTMTAKNPPVKVSSTTGGTVADASNNKLSMVFPAGAVTTDTDVSVTTFTEGAKKATTGSTGLGLVTFNAEPSGLTFAKPVTVQLKNPMGGSIRFGSVDHFVEKNGKWEKESEVSYDNASDSYLCEMKGFSNHSLRLSATVSASTKSYEELSTKVIDNLGKMAVKEEEVSLTEKAGWVIDGNLTSLLQSKYATLSANEVSTLADLIQNTLTSLLGSEAGTTDITSSMTLKVSGDTKMTTVFSAELQKFSVSFPLVLSNGNETFSVPVKKYTSTTTKTTYQYGNTHTDHSGGGGK